MAVATATFEAGTNGNAIQTSDPGSATAWDIINDPGLAQLTYDNAHASGTLAAKLVTAQTGSTGSLEWTTALGSPTDHYGRVYFYLENYPFTSNLRFVAASGFRFDLHTLANGGTVRVFDAAGFVGDTTIQYGIDQWVRLEWHVVHSATVGSVELKLFNIPDSNTPTETLSFTNRNTSTSLTSLQFGDAGGTDAAATIWFDNIVAGATEYPGPAKLTGTFETGVVGATIAVADPGSETPWDDRNFSNPNSTLTYSATQKYERLSAQSVFSATPQPAYVAWASGTLGTARTTVWGRIYMHHSGLPNTSVVAIRGLDTGVRAWEIAIDSAGLIVVRDNGGTARGTGVIPIVTGQWFRLEFRAVSSTTAGVVEAKLFNNPNERALTEVITSSGSFSTLSRTDLIRFGDIGGLNASRTVYMDNILVSDAGYPGPADGPLQVPMQSYVSGHNVW